MTPPINDNPTSAFPAMPAGGIYIATDERGNTRAWAAAGSTLPPAPANSPQGPFFSADVLREFYAAGYAAGLAAGAAA